MDFIPINPLRTKKGALVCMVEDFGEDAAKPVPLSTPTSALNNFQVHSDALSVSLAAKLGVGTIFNGSADYKDQGFYFDAMAYTDEYAQTTLPDQTVLATRWGVGLRVLLRVSQIQANVSLNFGMVGAAVELQQARAQYEINGIGIGAAGLVMVLKQLPAIGVFTYETYLKLDQVVAKDIATYIEANMASLVPQPVAVALAKSLDPLGNSRSVYFAMRSVANRKSLAGAIADAPGTLNRDTIRDVYTHVAGTATEAERPSSDAARNADRWLSV